MTQDWIDEVVATLPAMATMGEIAQTARVSTRTVARWVAAGELTSAKLGGQRVIIPRRAFAEFLRKREGR